MIRLFSEDIGYLFPGWVQVMSLISWLALDRFWIVSGSSRWFQVVPGFCFVSS